MTEVLLARLDDINASVAGAIATVSNVGTVGVGIFKQKTGTDAEFYKINPASSKISFALVGTDRIDVNVVEANLTIGNLSGQLGFARIGPVATDRLLGRDTAGSGAAEEIAVSGGIEFTGAGGIQTSAFTGDVTKSAGGTALTIPNNTVTYAKMQDVSAASRVLGRGSAAGAGDPQELTLGASLVMNGTVIERAALTGDVTAAQNGNATTIASNAVTNTQLADMAQGTVKGRAAGAGTGDPTDLTQAQAQVVLGFYPYETTPGGRLTLTSGTPVTISGVSAATSIYYAPHKHGFVSIYDGTNWASIEFSELTLALDADSGHTGYHQSGKNFDLFLYVDSGTLRLASGPAWTNDTTRADAIGRKNGKWTNNASITLRFGSASGNTVTAAANTALYVGTFRASANGQTDDSSSKRFLWNTYHRVPRFCRNAAETSNGYAYTTATIRQANANTANQFEYVRGLAEDMVEARIQASAQNTNAGVVVTVGVGLDSTTAFATGFHSPIQYLAVANMNFAVFGTWQGCPDIGYHYNAWLEWSQAVGATTWTGDFGDATLFQSGIMGTVWA